jgi:orotate phosphoribosyltransferase
MIDPKLVYGPTADISARALFQAEAFLISTDMRPEGFFTWKSGVRAPVYMDCRVIQGHPGPSRTLVRALASSIENSFPLCGAVAGMAEAGVVWSMPVSMELGVPHAFVRKTPKKHGTGRMVEGNLGAGDRVVLVDDLMGSGGTARDAISRIEETGAEVISVQTIVNWDLVEMRRRFEEISVPYRALVSFPQILSTAVQVGALTETAAGELRAFFQNPREHEWQLENLLPEVRDDGATSQGGGF